MPTAIFYPKPRDALIPYHYVLDLFTYPQHLFAARCIVYSIELPVRFLGSQTGMEAQASSSAGYLEVVLDVNTNLSIAGTMDKWQ